MHAFERARVGSRTAPGAIDGWVSCTGRGETLKYTGSGTSASPSSWMARPLTRFRLRIGDHEIWLPPGRFIIGRSPQCHIVLDDPLVSRRHAELIVNAQTVTVEDLNSINGVHVNGQPVIGAPQELRDGDHVVVGGRELVFLLQAGAGPQSCSQSDTLSGLDPVVPAESEDELGVETGRADVLGTLGQAAEHALAEGCLAEAQQLLTHLLMAVLRDAKGGRALPPETIEQAIHFAMRLAQATRSGAWFDYVVELLYYLGRLPNSELLDDLMALLANVDSVDLPRLSRYVAGLQSLASQDPVEQEMARAAALLLGRAQSFHG